MNEEEQSHKLGQIIAKARNDEAFRQRLLKDAANVLKEEGVCLPEGMEIRVVENTENIAHFVLPHVPDKSLLSDEQLNTVAGGFIFKTSTYS